VWHNQGVERDGAGQSRQGNSRKRPPKPLSDATLGELALHYVSRFATSRAKLASYLNRKLRERGWEGETLPDVDGLVERIAGLGYVDDTAYALAKAGSLSARGYGQGRVRHALRQAGIAEEDGASARELAVERAADAALRFARRKRIGPFAVSPADPRMREKALAAMIRAGHDLALARAVVSASPGEEITAEQLAASRS
jgi:regulatory protein